MFALWWAGSILSASGQLPFWQQYFGGKLFDEGKALLLQKDGSLIAVGERGERKTDVSLFRFATQGHLFWQLTLGNEGENRLSQAIQLTDGGVLLVGTTNAAGEGIPALHGRMDAWVVRISAEGKVLWQKVYGGTGNDRGISAIELADGGFLLGCESGSPKDGKFVKSNNHGGYDSWLVRVSAQGEVLWDKHLGGSKNDAVAAMLSISPTEIWVAHATDSPDGDVKREHTLGAKDVWLTSISPKGEILWQKTYGGSDNDDVYAMRKDKLGNIVLCGTTFSADGDIRTQHGEGDAWLLCLNAVGELRWSQTYGGTKPDGANDVFPTADGGYILAGMARSTNGDIFFNGGYYDAWVLKTDIGGNRQWSKCFGFSGREGFSHIVECPKGGYLAMGFAELVPDAPIPQHHGGHDWWFMNINDPMRSVNPFMTPPALQGEVSDKTTGKPLAATVILTENTTLDSLAVLNADTTGNFTLMLPTKGLVSINVLHPGYLFYGADILTDSTVAKLNVKQHIELTPITIGGSLTLNNIYFETGKWDLLKQSYAECERLVTFMRINPAVKIRLNGHTDNSGAREEKVTLSLNRANAVKDYLVKHGIDAKRMEVKGWGMYRPIADNNTAEGRMRNRRVEVEVTAK